MEIEVPATVFLHIRRKSEDRELEFHMIAYDTQQRQVCGVIQSPGHRFEEMLAEPIGAAFALDRIQRDMTRQITALMRSVRWW